MVTKNIKITDSVKSYSTTIGRVGEYGVTKIEFDLSEWVELYGSGTATLTFIPPASSEILINTTTSGNVLSWIVGTDATNKRGTGLARLRYSVTNGLKKSCEIYCEIGEGGTTNAQADTSSYKSWIESAEELLESLEEYADDVETIKENLLQKVGYAELVGNALKLYSDSTKTNLIGSINLPSSGGSSSGSDWTEEEIKAIIEAYGYITSSALTGYTHTSDIPTSDINANTSARHTHSNKSVLDGITSQRVTEWNGKSTFSGSYDDLTNKPTLFNGDYNSLANKPTIPTQVTDSHINDLIDAKLNGVETLLGGGF